MKKLLTFSFFILFLANENVQAQINQLASFNFARLTYIVFEYAGPKYVYLDQNAYTITVYNANYSVYKVLNIPPQPGSGYSICYLSEKLFDTDSSDLEYLLYYWTSGLPPNISTRIYDENGNTLFSKNIASPGSSGVYSQFAQQSLPIYNGLNGAEMILTRDAGNGYSAKSWVYSLPGHLFCPPCDQGVGFTGGGNESFRLMNNSDFEIGTFPNPASSYTKVYFELPEGVTIGELVFFNTLGNEVKRFTVENLFNYIQVSTDDLPSGTYSYKIITTQGASEGKQLVVVQ